MSRVVVILPLKEGARESARRLLEQGPPFDPETTSFDRHHVFLSDREVVFLFEGPDAKTAVEQLIGDPSVWRTATAWRECLAGRPRLGQDAYSWVRPREPEGISFAPTPGPGDSEGGDLYTP